MSTNLVSGTETTPRGDYDLLLRAASVIILLYTFLIGVKCLSTGMKMMGSEFANSLFQLGINPLAGLIMGMFATVLFQSSSVTTAIIVGLVSANTLNISQAIPMIMGANLGTSVTNTIVSLGHIKNRDHFEKAFAAATVHDFFNILTVLVLLPLELMFGFIEKMALSSSNYLYGNIAGLNYKSPIKMLIGPPVKWIQNLSISSFGKDIAGIVVMILAALIIIMSLSFIVKTMKSLIEKNKTDILNKLLSKNPYVGIGLGALVTVAVQSSSITTSLLIPMAGTGFLNLRSIYPITIGANIGTTTTALLAALTGNVAGLAIALVHLFFNLFGAMLFFPIKALREIPIWCAETLAATVQRTKLIGLGYIACFFFIIPMIVFMIVS